MEPYLEVQYKCVKHRKANKVEEPKLIEMDTKIETLWSNRGHLLYEGELANAVRTALATRTLFTKEIDRSENQRYASNREDKDKNEKEASISSVAILKKIPLARSEFILSNNVLKNLPNEIQTSVKDSNFLSLPVTLIIIVTSTMTVIVIIVTVAALITQVIQIKPISIRLNNPYSWCAMYFSFRGGKKIRNISTTVAWRISLAHCHKDLIPQVIVAITQKIYQGILLVNTKLSLLYKKILGR